MSEFISIPLNIRREPHLQIECHRGDVEASIDNFLELVVFTPKGAFDADPDFGFEYWNHEGTNISLREFNSSYMSFDAPAGLQNETTRTQCENSLKQSILTYEPRLKQPEVKIELNVNTGNRTRKLQSKYEMCIQVLGYIDDGMGMGRQYEKKIVFLVEPTAKKSI